jgi:hypothetical protein
MAEGVKAHRVAKMSGISARSPMAQFALGTGARRDARRRLESCRRAKGGSDRVLGFDGDVLFFLLPLLDWPIILIAGLGTWFWGGSSAAIIAYCVLAPVVQAAVAAYAHVISAFQPILLADRLRRCRCLGLRGSGFAQARSTRQRCALMFRGAR